MSEQSEQKQGSSAVSALGTLIVMAVGGWYYLGGGLEQHAAREMDKIEVQVANDAVKQYEIAKRSGSAMDACSAAGMMAAAYLQAQDEAGYQRAQALKDKDCRSAGLSQ